MELILTLFAKLMIAHFICDYPLQGEFLAKAKNHTEPTPGINPALALISHAAIQAGGVWFITGSGVFAAVEFAAHILIDFTKCAKWISFTEDQALHTFCKLVYAIFIVLH